MKKALLILAELLLIIVGWILTTVALLFIGAMLEKDIDYLVGAYTMLWVMFVLQWRPFTRRKIKLTFGEGLPGIHETSRCYGCKHRATCDLALTSKEAMNCKDFEGEDTF